MRPAQTLPRHKNPHSLVPPRPLLPGQTEPPHSPHPGSLDQVQEHGVSAELKASAFPSGPVGFGVCFVNMFTNTHEDRISVLVPERCCNKSTIHLLGRGVLKHFLTALEARSPRSRGWQIRCLVMSCLLVCKWLFAVSSHSGRDKGGLW